MTRHWILRAFISATLAAAMMAGGIPAIADSAVPPPEELERLEYLAEAALDGTITEPELQELIDDFPEAAESLPHPEPEVTHTETWVLPPHDEEPAASFAGLDAMESSSTTCKRLTSTVTYKSTFKISVLYVYEKAASRCYSGSKVTKIYDRTNRYTRFSSIGLEDQGRIENWVTGAGTSKTVSYMKRKVYHYVPGVKILVLGYSYPWIKQTFNGSGTYSVSRGY